ncbi:MAG TPA: FIST N-terminal domain-containing protein [Opitutus sp.]|nr:FIST N-terminal domain-containing protein [Opitutus sp.]
MKLEQFQWTAARGWAPSLDQAKLGANAQLVLLFGRGGLVVAHDVIALARRTFPRAQVIGCSTGGEIHGAEVHDDTLSLTAIGFEHSRVTVASAPIPGIDHSFDAGVALMRQLDPAGLRHVFVMSEGLLVNSSELVDGVNSVLAPGVTVSGGFAADGNNLRVTEVWCNGEPKKSAAVALGFYGERLDVGVAVTGAGGLSARTG